MSEAAGREDVDHAAASIDKRDLIARLQIRLADDLALLERRQRDTAEAATHEENRAEHAKDTRATEQGYLARGLAERVASTRRSLEALAALVPRLGAPGDAIAVGSLVRLREEEAATPAAAERPAVAPTSLWLILPVAGGLELDSAAGPVRTLTPGSPLGRALLGLGAGDEGGFRSPRGERRFEVLAVG